MRKWIMLTGLLAAGAVSAGVIFSDNFSSDDGSWLGDGALTVDGSAHATTTLHGSTYSMSFLKHFNAESLAVGDTIEVTWIAKGVGFASTGNLLRFGLYNSGANQLTTDTAYEDSTMANWVGYGIHSTNTRANSTSDQYAIVTIYERINANNVLIASSAFGTALGQTADGMETMGTNTWTPEQKLTMTRTASGYDITTELGGIVGNATYPVNVSTYSISNDNVTSFDTLGFWYSTGNAALDFAIDDVTVTVIPEPATLGLMGVIFGGILFWRRLLA